jgi:hypothetical protein
VRFSSVFPTVYVRLFARPNKKIWRATERYSGTGNTDRGHGKSIGSTFLGESAVILGESAVILGESTEEKGLIGI